jgi:polyhydroxyalkanoate synthesis repressor PhaR
MSNKPRVIRKYANRRLYDPAASRHVTMEDIRKLIFAGEEVQVVDDRSGEDLTRTVLLQIVAEQEHFGKPILSEQLLHSIIRFYGTAMEELTGQYLEKSMANLLEQQGLLEEQMRNFVKVSPMTSVMDVARQNMEIWTKLQQQMFSPVASTNETPKKK